MTCRIELPESNPLVGSLATAMIPFQTSKPFADSINCPHPPLALDRILQGTTAELRQLLKVDRVAIFKFDSDTDWDGQFIAEDVAADCSSIMTQQGHDSHFGEQFAVQYHQGQIQAIADIHATDLSPYHIDILGQFQVRANLVVPILQGQYLWGLLCVHHCQFPRPWHQEEITFVQQIVENLGMAVQQAEHPSKSQPQDQVLTHSIDYEQALIKTISKIRQVLEINLGHVQNWSFFGGESSRFQLGRGLETLFQVVTTEMRHLLAADRVAIFQFDSHQDACNNSHKNSYKNSYKNCRGRFVAEEVSNNWSSILAEQVHADCLGEQFADQFYQGDAQAINDIYADSYASKLTPGDIDFLEHLQVRAQLVAPIGQGERLWGVLCIHQCVQVRHWHRDEIKCVQHVAEHLGGAMEQLTLVDQLRDQTEQQKSLTDLITNIHASVDLETTFQTTAQGVRDLLKTDRVGIFFFQCEQDWDGQFIAEDHGNDISPILLEAGYEHCFDESHTLLYRDGHTYISHNIYDDDLKDICIQTLERFEIKANVVSPIMNGSELWGLLCIHHCQSPRRWQPTEIELVHQITQHLGIALEQWSQVEKFKLQTSQLAYISSRERALEQQQLLSQTINAIRDSLQIEEIFDTTTKSIQSLFKTDRVVIYQFNSDWSGQFVAESVAEGWPELIKTQDKIQDTDLMETQGGRYAQQETLVVDDIYQTDYESYHMALLEDFHARAYVIVPIMEGNRLWGLLAACQCSGSRHWETDEIDFLAQVSAQLGVALNQAEAVAQVREQAAALQKVTDRQRALTLTIEKIRQSLDIDVIFTTTTQEVRQLLEVDRVAIYRFNPDWSGAFVADSIVDSWQPTIPTQTIIQDVFPKPDQDGQLPRNEVFVPISQGEKLWGLLMAYQTSKPRYWDDDEVGLLTQVGAHLGIALQQAELLNQTQQQTVQLNQTLQTLKSTQARLVQGEKMAGLGQLAAGIAHEINNPVGFISSNLEPMQEYVTGLLELLRLYQRHYPQPEQVIQEKMDDIEVDFILDDLPKIMTSMKMGTTRIVDIVKGMQTFSRVDEAAIKNVDIHQGIDSAILILKHRLKAYNDRPTINVVKSYGDLPLIQCHASHLNQVFMNILVNAVDAFDENDSLDGTVPEIRITTRWQPQQNCLLIEFSDNGLGISEEVLANIFNPFFTTKPVGKGTGLGLSISYQIVTDMHQGKLYCQSTVGKGTTFFIEIPAAIS